MHRKVYSPTSINKDNTVNINIITTYYSRKTITSETQLKMLNSPNAGAAVVECDCKGEAGVNCLLNEKPVKDPAAPEEAAELAAATVEALVAAEEELTPNAGKANEACVAVVVVPLLLVAGGVEALVVVTVENGGAVDVPKDREEAFAVGAVETAVAADEAVKPNEG
jgi:hypothetical protein